VQLRPESLHKRGMTSVTPATSFSQTQCSNNYQYLFYTLRCTRRIKDNCFYS